MPPSGQPLDPSFTDLPLRRLADAALSRARDFSVEHADFRLERIRSQSLLLRDGHLQGSAEGDDLGFAVRVIHAGTWGFSASVVLTAEEAVRVTEQAIRVAQVAAQINTERVELAEEPVHADATWVSAYDVDPFRIATADKVALLGDWSARLLAGLTYACSPTMSRRSCIRTASPRSSVSRPWVLTTGRCCRCSPSAGSGAGLIFATTAS